VLWESVLNAFPISFKGRIAPSATALTVTRHDQLRPRSETASHVGAVHPIRVFLKVAAKLPAWKFALEKVTGELVCTCLRNAFSSAPIRATVVKRAYGSGPVTTRASGLG
jgi:hypothetical protein